MNYVTTNIRISEEDYLMLKAEAAQKRKSLSAIVREKVTRRNKKYSDKEADRLMKSLRVLAKKNAKYFRGLDGVKLIREMRDNAKW